MMGVLCATTARSFASAAPRGVSVSNSPVYMTGAAVPAALAAPPTAGAAGEGTLAAAIMSKKVVAAAAANSGSLMWDKPPLTSGRLAERKYMCTVADVLGVLGYVLVNRRLVQVS